MVVTLLLAAALAAPEGAACPPELFRIGRSTNANEVVYAARVVRGALDPDRPITAEWHMLAQDGHREGLNFLEKLIAYGFSVDDAEGGDGFVVVLKAKKDRPVHLRMRGTCPDAFVTISGRTALLRKIFVQTKGGGVVPEVAWADVEGRDPETGAVVKERIYPPQEMPSPDEMLGPR
jgi:hypothetical protein